MTCLVLQRLHVNIKASKSSLCAVTAPCTTLPLAPRHLLLELFPLLGRRRRSVAVCMISQESHIMCSISGGTNKLMEECLIGSKLCVVLLLFLV